MGVRHYSHLVAWQLAAAFEREVLVLLTASTSVSRNLRYVGQLSDAATAVAKDIAEGFVRFNAREFMRFLDYAAASLVEAEGRLRNGVALRYFSASDCQDALRFATRCLPAIIKLKHSQQRYIDSTEREPRSNEADPRPRRRALPNRRKRHT